jgi:dolichol kinase
MDYEILATELLKIACYGLVGWICGVWIRWKSIKVNYTRKINFFALFLTPILISRIYPYEPTPQGTVLRVGFFISFLLLFIKPIRDRISFLKTIFLSWDRPEDQPHTLFWLSTQLIAGYAILIPMDVLFNQYGFANLVLIPVLVHGIGDGLAEPVGVRFGRHKYAARAFFSKRRYTRSLEGSACVLIAAFLIIFLFRSSFNTPQFIVALLTVPILMTLAEAVSPHTWDTPLLYLSGFSALWGIKIFI